MFWLKLLRDIIKLFEAGETPKQIALGFAFGCVLGLSPSLNLQGILVWVLILILDINLGATLLGATIFTLVAFLMDPVFHAVGFFLLTKLDFLKGLYTFLYNAPVAPLSRFNNTVVIGSFVVAWILFAPVFYGTQTFVIKYRDHISAKVHKWKIYKILNRSLLVKWYSTIKKAGGIK